MVDKWIVADVEQGEPTMAWEVRNGVRYYYVGSRRGGRVCKRYLGRGPAAELAAAALEDAVARRADARAELHADQGRLAGPERALRELDEACDLLMAAELTAAGYHRQNYSAWRRRRA